MDWSNTYVEGFWGRLFDGGPEFNLKMVRCELIIQLTLLIAHHLALSVPLRLKSKADQSLSLLLYMVNESPSRRVQSAALITCAPSQLVLRQQFRGGRTSASRTRHFSSTPQQQHNVDIVSNYCE